MPQRERKRQVVRIFFSFVVSIKNETKFLENISESVRRFHSDTRTVSNENPNENVRTSQSNSNGSLFYFL